MLCTSSVLFLGRKREVVIDSCGRPTVTLTFTELADNDLWRRLPDEGSIWLSGHQTVELVVVDETLELTPANHVKPVVLREWSFRALKEQIAERLNDQQFERWPQPELVVPDAYDLEAPTAEIHEGVYGKCVLTGKPLVAYGVITVKRAVGNDAELRLTTHWTPFRAAAESLLSEAVQALESARSETVPDLPAPGKLQAP